MKAVAAGSKAAFAITPGAANMIRRPYQGIYVGGTGNVVVDFGDGTSITFSAVPAGAFLPISPTKVLGTSTATLMVGV